MWFYLVRVRLILFGAVRCCKEKGGDLLLGLLARLLGITCVEDLLACLLAFLLVYAGLVYYVRMCVSGWV